VHCRETGGLQRLKWGRRSLVGFIEIWGNAERESAHITSRFDQSEETPIKHPENSLAAVLEKVPPKKSELGSEGTECSRRSNRLFASSDLPILRN